MKSSRFIDINSAVVGAASASRELQIVDGIDAIARAAPAWDRLVERAKPKTPFQTLAVASACAAAHSRRGDVPRIIIISRAGQPMLIFPTVVTTFFGLPIVRFLGDPLIQYGDVLAAPEANPEDFAVAFSAAMDPNVACFALFRHVRDDAEAADTFAHIATEALVQESPLVDLRQPSVVSARNARELRRLRRRLAERGTIETCFIVGAEARTLVGEALKFKRGWLKEHGFASAVIGDADWERAICDLCDERTGLTVAALMVAGRLAAIEVAFVDATCWYGFLGAFKPEFARMGPGQVLTADCLARARSLGLAYYDQLPPSQPYKRQQATGAIIVRDYALALRPTGRLALAAAKMVPELKSLLGALPPDVRRRLLALFGQ